MSEGTLQLSGAGDAIIAPMLDSVMAFDVGNDSSFNAGERTMVLEPINMEHALGAPYNWPQNELEAIPTARKFELVDELLECELKSFEVTSYVNSKWVPQLANVAEVKAGIARSSVVSFSVLLLNQKAVEHAMPACRYVSCITDCPYDGTVETDQVARVAYSLLTLGYLEFSLGHTIGAVTPDRVDEMIESVLSVVPADKLTSQHHNTNGLALENIPMSLKCGLKVFDSPVGGLGGCPNASGAEGNDATEEFAQLIHDRGFGSGIDLEPLILGVVPLACTLRYAR